MAAFALTSDQYPSVRAAIGLDVDTVNMPDSIIALPIYVGEAERYIMRSLTETQYENPDYIAQVKYAAVLYLASLLVPTIRLVKSERITGGNLTYDEIDLTALAASLATKAADQIANILEAAGVSIEGEVPNMFSLAHRQLPISPFDF